MPSTLDRGHRTWARAAMLSVPHRERHTPALQAAAAALGEEPRQWEVDTAGLPQSLLPIARGAAPRQRTTLEAPGVLPSQHQGRMAVLAARGTLSSQADLPRQIPRPGIRSIPPRHRTHPHPRQQRQLRMPLRRRRTQQHQRQLAVMKKMLGTAILLPRRQPPLLPRRTPQPLRQLPQHGTIDRSTAWSVDVPLYARLDQGGLNTIRLDDLFLVYHLPNEIKAGRRWVRFAHTSVVRDL